MTTTIQWFVAICAIAIGLAAFTPASAGEKDMTVSPSALNIALFARVVTSDPARTDGAKAGRLEEFRAEDVFLTTEILPGKNGCYEATKHEDGRACIGLQWAEKRVLSEVSLQFPAGAKLSAEGIEVQYWSSAGREDSWGGIGQTPWQGQWEKLSGEIKVKGDSLVVSIDGEKVPEFKNGTGTFGVRWIFPKSDGRFEVRGLSALGVSKWTAGKFRLEAASGSAGPVTIHAYNGLISDSDNGDGLTKKWQPARPLDIEVQYSVPAASKADRTLIRFELPDGGGFSVAIEDVLKNDGVYVKDYGIFVTRSDSGVTLDKYREEIAGRETILEKVRKMPDQTFAEAMKVLHRDSQNTGPTMLSLACDNNKFIIDRNGTIHGGRLMVTPHFWLGKADLVHMDFGEIGLDTTVRPPGSSGLPMQIADKTYKKGVGLHANAELVVPLGGKFETFEAEVGVYPSQGEGGSVIFQIDVDGENKFDSGVMKKGEAAKAVKISLAGAKKMLLRLRDGGDGISNDAGNFADARLTPAGAKQADAVYLSDFLRQLGFADTASERRLADDGWLPIIENRATGGGIVYRQQTYVAPYDLQQQPMDAIGKARSVCVGEFVIENPASTAASANMRLDFSGGGAELKLADGRLLVTAGEGLLACADIEGWGEKEISINGGTLELSCQMQPKTTRSFRLYIPAWEMKADDNKIPPGNQNLRNEVGKYWNAALAGAMQLDVPEPLVGKVYRATQVHCMMAARNSADGALIEPWIASNTYGPLDTEAQAVILGMDYSGQHEFARRSTEMFINSYNEHGMLVKGYTLMGLGQHLWTLGKHYELAPDRQWLRKFEPKLLLASQWIAAQTQKTKKLDPAGNRLPEYGLVPPGVLGDWNRYAYYMYVNAHFEAGLQAVAEMLSEIDCPEAGRLKQAADEYRQDILAAYRWNQARMPVLPLRDGTWVPATPSSVYTFGLTREFFGGISAIGHDVEAGGNHLIPLGLIDPKSRQADWAVNYLEDRWFFIDGLFGAYPSAEAEQNWFDEAGFSKLQPHYTRMCDIHALRDDVKPFIRTYFNMFPLLLNMENLTYWEHFNAGGGWNKTHESGWFLEMTRTMMLTERGDDLWLAPFVTYNWLKDGMTVGVSNAPTRFGPVSYRITSFVKQGYIEARIDFPTRSQPDNVVIRIRHPEGKKMQSVTANGKEYKNFDPAADTITLKSTKAPVALRVNY